jgi:CSLREA domain-containing protein
MKTPKHRLATVLFMILASIVITTFTFTRTATATGAIQVNSTADTASDDGQCTLREAITAANTDTASGTQIGECAAGNGDDTIGFAPGVTGIISLSGVLPDITSNMSINGPGAAVLTVGRDGEETTGKFRIFKIASGINVSFSGLTITNGFVLGADGIGRGGDAFGGGIFNAGTLSVNACNVTHNIVQGGNVTASIDPSPNDSTIEYDYPVGGTPAGGGIYNLGTLTLTGSYVGRNWARFGYGQDGEGYGAGIYNHGSMTIVDTTIDQNYFRLEVRVESPIFFKGGGIHNDGNLTLVRTVVRNNASLDGDRHGSARFKGGGISSSSGIVNMTDCTVTENKGIAFIWGNLGPPPFDPRAAWATAQGGGIYLFSGELIVRNTTVSNNFVRGSSPNDPGHGAGLFVESGTLSLVNSTVSGNAAQTGGCGLGCIDIPKAEGGGIYLRSGTAAISNSTIAHNQVQNSNVQFVNWGAGGGIYMAGGTVRLNNTIIANNLSSKNTNPNPSLANSVIGGADSDVDGVVASQGHNLVGTASGSGGWVGSDLLGNDPLLGPLQSNGGLTGTHMPLAGSLAINTGNNTGAPEKDQRGLTRLGPDNQTVDIGAIEARYHAPVARCQNVTRYADETGHASVSIEDINNNSSDLDNDPLSFSLDHSDLYNAGVTTVMLTVTDTISLSSSCNATVSLIDNSAPVLSLPADITAEADLLTGKAVSFNVSASDNVNGAVAINCTATSGSIFSLGSTTVQCSAVDASDNTANGSFKITVRDHAPVFNDFPREMSVEAASAAGAVVTWTTPTALDVVDGPVAVDCSAVVYTTFPAQADLFVVLRSGGTFPIGTSIVFCSAQDSRGSETGRGFLITVRDNTSPVLTLPGDVTVDTTNASGANATWAPATANDLVDGSVPVNCTHASGHSFSLGTTAVTCTATDARGNTASAQFSVTVVLRLIPTLSILGHGAFTYDGLPHGVSVSVTGTNGEDLLAQGTLTVTYTDASGQTSANAPRDAGAYAVNVSFASNLPSYANARDSMKTITIAKPLLNIEIKRAVKAYGDPLPNFSVDYSGFVNGETVNVLGGTLAFDTSATATSPAGVYFVTPKGLTAANYEIRFEGRMLLVARATLSVTAGNASRRYGETNPVFTGTIIGIKNSDPISVNYSTPANSTSAAGTYSIHSMLEDPSGKLDNYEVISTPGTLTVNKANVTLTWSDPSPIVYGTPLSAAQLNAAANVAGTFIYTPAAGSILKAGSNQSLSVSFTPTDTTNYNTATASVKINVLKATPLISWNNPADLLVGASLGIAQLNAAASFKNVNVPGVFTYTPPAGSLLSAGMQQTLSVSFTPADLVNYNPANAIVKINVLTTEQAVSDLVTGLVNAGLVSRSSSTALSDLLVKAIKSIKNDSNRTKAINQLEALKNMIAAAVYARRMTATQGQALTEAINKLSALIKP